MRREERGFNSLMLVPLISSRSIILTRSFGVFVALNVITMCVLVFLSREVKKDVRGMAEMLSKMMRMCGVDARGGFSGNIPERTCVSKEMMLIM